MVLHDVCSRLPDTRQITSPNDNVRGEIKLSVQYHRGALTVMVIINKIYSIDSIFYTNFANYNIAYFQIYHARSLPPTTSGQEPNTYVKAYLKPDPTKSTKRKTKVVRKNCFPSFMETVNTDFKFFSHKMRPKKSLSQPIVRLFFIDSQKKRFIFDDHSLLFRVFFILFSNIA